MKTKLQCNTTPRHCCKLLLWACPPFRHIRVNALLLRLEKLAVTKFSLPLICRGAGIVKALKNCPPGNSFSCSPLSNFLFFFLTQSSAFCRGVENGLFTCALSAGDFLICQYWRPNFPFSIVLRVVAVQELTISYGLSADHNFKLQNSSFKIRTSNSVGTLSVSIVCLVLK